MYTTEGLSEQGKFGLEVAVKVIDYFSKVFGIDYMLPKCDLLAVHEFGSNAMENWGLITYVRVFGLISVNNNRGTQRSCLTRV